MNALKASGKSSNDFPLQEASIPLLNSSTVTSPSCARSNLSQEHKEYVCKYLAPLDVNDDFAPSLPMRENIRVEAILKMLNSSITASYRPHGRFKRIPTAGRNSSDL